MVEDLGVEAKEASVREVAKLLPLPELLQSIASIKADYIARQQVYFTLYNLAIHFILNLYYLLQRILLIVFELSFGFQGLNQVSLLNFRVNAISNGFILFTIQGYMKNYCNCGAMINSGKCNFLGHLGYSF